MQGQWVAHTGRWLVQNKEVLAAVGALLGVVPKAVDTLLQMNRQQREARQLLVEKQILELSKLRYEIEKIRRDLGEAPAPVPQPPLPHRAVAEISQPTPEVTVTKPVPPPAAAEAAQRIPEVAVTKPVSTPSVPAVVRWLQAHPPAGGVVLWLGQAVLWILFAFSALVMVVFPVTMLANATNRQEIGTWGVLGVELIYILMSWAFLRLYQKVRRWRKVEPTERRGAPADPV